MQDQKDQILTWDSDLLRSDLGCARTYTEAQLVVVQMDAAGTKWDTTKNKHATKQ